MSRIICPEKVLGDRYAFRNNGTCYYPKDGYGNEYKDDRLGFIAINSLYIYPLTSSGKPKYPIINGKEIYEIYAGRAIIGKGVDGNEYYAKDRYGNEYYPEGNICAKLKDGTPYYASTVNDSNIFPFDSYGNEYYFTFVDLTKPSTIPNRYAVSFAEGDIYPLRLTNEGNESQYIINNTYAIDKDRNQFYPKDGYKNEYYLDISQLDIQEFNRKGTLGKILLERYALTNDRKIILPELQNAFYINTAMKPVVKTETVIGRLIRDDGQIKDFLTNISESESTVLEKPYKYKTLVTNETKFIAPKPPVTNFTFFGILNAAIPFYQRWCFWVLVIIVVIIKTIFLVWWFFLRTRLPSSIFDNIKL